MITSTGLNLPQLSLVQFFKVSAFSSNQLTLAVPERLLELRSRPEMDHYRSYNTPKCLFTCFQIQ